MVQVLLGHPCCFHLSGDRLLFPSFQADLLSQPQGSYSLALHSGQFAGIWLAGDLGQLAV